MAATIRGQAIRAPRVQDVIHAPVGDHFGIACQPRRSTSTRDDDAHECECQEERRSKRTPAPMAGTMRG
jgi:hypothetical protein